MPKGKDKEEQVPAETVDKVMEPETLPGAITETEETLEGEKTEEEQLKEEIKRLNIGLARKEGEIKKLRERGPQQVQPTPIGRAYQIMLDDMKARQAEFGESNPRIAQLESLIAEEKRQIMEKIGRASCRERV